MNGSERSDGLVSFGPGIQREVWFHLFEKYRQDLDEEWLQYRCDARAGIKTIYPLATCRFIPDDRLCGLKKLGAICAMLFVLGGCPAPLDPCIFQFAVHGFQLEALHSSFIAEWHPRLRTKLLAWNQLGPSGDILAYDTFLEETLGFGVRYQHFNCRRKLTHTSIQASHVQHRTEAVHKSLAATLLYQSLFGPEPPFHPEWKAFFAGFSLPCRNGFNFLSVFIFLYPVV